MDVQCPAVILCLDPDDEVPVTARDRRIVAGYLLEGAAPPEGAEIPVNTAPVGSFWDALLSLADAHRGEAIALFAPAQTLERFAARGATFEVDSDGPLRV